MGSSKPVNRSSDGLRIAEKSVYFAIQDRRQLPADLDWLGANERTRLASFRFDKRRHDWLLGRWTAKQALLTVAGLSDPDRIEIATADDGAPLPRLDGRPFAATISLSHSNDRAFCTVTLDRTELGCDIELVEPRGTAFVETYFTNTESERIANADKHCRDLLTTMIWSAKESVLKALRIGLGVDTRSVEVIPDDHGPDTEESSEWRTGRVIAADDGEFACCWLHDGSFVFCVAGRAPLPTPLPAGSGTLAA